MNYNKCEKCKHNQVCKLMEEYEQYWKTIEKITIPVDKKYSVSAVCNFYDDKPFILTR